MQLTEDSKVKQTERELKLHLFMLLFMFLSTQDYWESMTMKHFSTNKMTSITCPGGDLQGEYISRCTCHSVSWQFLSNRSTVFEQKSITNCNVHTSVVLVLVTKQLKQFPSWNCVICFKNVCLKNIIFGENNNIQISSMIVCMNCLSKLRRN